MPHAAEAWVRISTGVSEQGDVSVAGMDDIHRTQARLASIRSEGSVLLNCCQKAPQVTRDRMYVDTMKEVFSNVTKVMVDAKSGSNLLYLPLDKIMQMTAQSPTTSPTTVTPPPSAGTASTPASRSLDNAARSRDRESR